jgi:hypothetical protein
MASKNPKLKTSPANLRFVWYRLERADVTTENEL